MTAETAPVLLLCTPDPAQAEELRALLLPFYRVELYDDLQAVARRVGIDTGLLLLTQQALRDDPCTLAAALRAQPEWSQVPIMLLTPGKLGAADQAYHALPEEAGHVVVLERPFSLNTLLSMVAACWHARARQYDMRDRLAELAEERGRLQALLENIPVGVCFMDEHGQSLIRNPLYRRYVPDDLIPSRSPENALRWVALDDHGSPLPRDMFPGAQALRGVPVNGIEFRHTLEDGMPSWMRVSAVPLYGEQGKIIGAASVIVDINKEKQAELSLRRFADELETQVQARTQALDSALQQLKAESAERARAEEQLRQSLKMEAVGQLTGGIAHDFNNMLTGVISALELIRLRLGKGRLDGVERFMDAAYSSAQSAASLTQRLLAFSRRQSLDSRPVQVNTLILAFQQLLEGLLTEQVRVELQLCSEDPWIWADANQLENAVLNLVINARDAMPDGGVLTIATGLQPGKGGQEMVDISVRDSGAGIPRRLLDKVLEPFFTTKPIGQGTGLGLSMVYGFATQSGGHLGIASEEGEGTTVTISLPQCVTRTEDAEVMASAAIPGNGQTILLVEDDDSVRLINQEVLQELGYQVVVARQAEEALRLLDDLPSLDLLVSDVGLPGMNGRQLAEVLQQLYPRLPVLFLTGYAEGAIKREDFLGPDMHLLTKPFSLDVLAHQVAQMLERRASHARR
ncbi:response regulator [Pseudomonas sp. DTU_2021_1001937_2_SI_NGA_ILE_001]|uniref:ATP-binding protein n=1 Tax=Pseudomonas sp. DTU_2021_1001937_2_SI_NGA_ILE_001 TaxID=3077589 RepID=UPI0028FC3352|nr:ATP-binding protein [Pseudomonas sp. DTU_2021_1001937_2_SI_NGA_ILE_001]WNW09837.1 response regulator [Pseudomonas sp. DTU_2021_1001937_2_SI_NGA_ILE_001]